MIFKDLTGQKFSRLTVIKRDESKKGTYWVCKCDCGKILSVRGDQLKSGNTKSCGCLNAENIHRKKRNYVDISGQRYGDLEVLDYAGSDKYGTRWKCKCHLCGKIKEIPATWLKRYTSCGCREDANRKKNVEGFRKLVEESGSNPIILKEEPNANNTTTGIRGVCYIKSTGKYVAYITYQKIRYTLKRSTDLQECIKARKEAEERITGDFLEWYNAYKSAKKPPAK